METGYSGDGTLRLWSVEVMRMVISFPQHKAQSEIPTIQHCGIISKLPELTWNGRRFRRSYIWAVLFYFLALQKWEKGASWGQRKRRGGILGVYMKQFCYTEVIHTIFTKQMQLQIVLADFDFGVQLRNSC